MISPYRDIGILAVKFFFFLYETTSAVFRGISSFVYTCLDYSLGYYDMWFFFNDTCYSKANLTQNKEDERIQWVYNVPNNSLVKTNLNREELCVHKPTWLSATLMDGEKTHLMDEWFDTFKCFTSDFSRHDDYSGKEYFPSLKLLTTCWSISTGNWIPGNTTIHVIDENGNENSYNLADTEKWSNDIENILYNTEVASNCSENSETAHNGSEGTSRTPQPAQGCDCSNSEYSCSDEEHYTLDNTEAVPDLARFVNQDNTENSSHPDPVHNTRLSALRRTRQNSSAE